MTDLKLVKFEDYLANEAVFRQHKDILLKNGVTPNKVASDIASDFNLISTKYEVISKPQSILKFSQKASDMGWRNLEGMSKKAFDICEKEGALLNDCLSHIKKIQEFSDASNLSDEHKDAVYRELEYYKDQQVTLVTFSKDFRTKFNEKVNRFNSEFTKNQSVKSAVTNNIIELPKNIVKNESDMYTPYVGMMFLFFALFFVIKQVIFSKRKKKTILAFFNIQKTSKFRVRLFGEITKKNVDVLYCIGQKLSQLFKIKYSALFGELKIVFSIKKDFSKIELKMTGNESSFHSFYRTHTGEFSDAFKFIISDLEKEGHEVAMTTQFGTDGKVQSSSLMIYSPN